MSGVGDLAARLVTPIPPRHVIGRAVADPVTGAVTVDIGGGEIVAGVPGSVRGVAEGQMLRVSVEGRTATVDAILTGELTPTVTAPPSAVSGSSPTSSGCYDGYFTDDAQAAVYAQDIAEVTRFLAGDINDLVGRVEAIEDALNDLRASYAEIRTGLINAGVIAAP